MNTRLFFAVLPPVALGDDLERLALDLRIENGLKGKPLRKDRFHVTLSHVADSDGVPHDLIKRSTRAANTIKHAPFEIRFDRVKSFPARSNAPLVLQSSEITAQLLSLRRELISALAAEGIPATKAFVPHLTLLYDDQKLADKNVPTMAWTVHEFILILSRLGESTYQHIARWPLHPPA